MEPESNEIIIAMTLLTAPTVPDVNRIVAALREATGTRYAITDVLTSDGTATFALDGDLVTITDMGAPVPWSDLEGPATKNWRWPTAEQECQAGQSHHIVTLSTNDPDPFQARLKLTDVVAADVAASGAFGVYWCEGAVVNSADVFTEMAESAGPDALPLYLWLTFHVVPVTKKTWFFATQGMSAFGFMEIELERATRKPMDAVGLLYNIANYLLSHGDVLEDGNTIGMSAKQKLLVRHVESTWDKGQRVYRLSDG